MRAKFLDRTRMSAYSEPMPQRGMGLRQRHRSATRRRSDLAGPRILRVCGTASPDTDVRYAHVVAGGEVDRVEWARVVRELLAELTRGKKAPLARLLGFSERTIDRWLLGTVDVNESSIRQVATRSGRPAMELLIRVGFYSRDQLPAPAVPPEDAWIVEAIEQSNVKLDPAVKARLIAVELERARREREERRRRIAGCLLKTAPGLIPWFAPQGKPGAPEGRGRRCRRWSSPAQAPNSGGYRDREAAHRNRDRPGARRPGRVGVATAAKGRLMGDVIDLAVRARGKALAASQAVTSTVSDALVDDLRTANQQRWDASTPTCERLLVGLRELQ